MPNSTFNGKPVDFVTVTGSTPEEAQKKLDDQTAGRNIITVSQSGYVDPDKGMVHQINAVVEKVNSRQPLLEG